MSTATSTTTVESAVEKFQEWQLAGGRFKGPQELPTLSSWSETTERRFNLKNSGQRRFLQWENQTFGINLGYTDDASEATAHKVSRWFFRRNGSAAGPVVYGECLAMGYGTSPSFYKYADRTVGVNIANTGTPSYEWRLIGDPGSSGKPVKTGEWLAIYNDMEKGFLIYFNRDAGVDLGWPDSKTWSQRAIGWATDAAKKAVENYVKSYIAG